MDMMWPINFQELVRPCSIQDLFDNIFALWALTLTVLNIIYIIHRATRARAAPKEAHPDTVACKEIERVAETAVKSLDDAIARVGAEQARNMDAWRAGGERKYDAMLYLSVDSIACEGKHIVAEAELAKAQIANTRMRRTLDFADKQRQAAVAQCLEACIQAKAEKEQTLERLKRTEAALASQEDRNVDLKKKYGELEAVRKRTEEQMKKVMREKDELVETSAKEKEELEQALHRKGPTELKAALEDFMTVRSESQ
ncbi:hypothetical protein VTO73DRAFT_3329 [Trametes versicolor]